jgi:hypothetical protein
VNRARLRLNKNSHETDIHKNRMDGGRAMIDPRDFDQLVADVAALNNLSQEQAFAVVVAVGDTPEIDEPTGKIVAELADGTTLLVNYPDAD